MFLLAPTDDVVIETSPFKQTYKLIFNSFIYICGILLRGLNIRHIKTVV